jgi:hypothetical protein
LAQLGRLGAREQHRPGNLPLGPREPSSGVTGPRLLPECRVVSYNATELVEPLGNRRAHLQGRSPRLLARPPGRAAVGAPSAGCSAARVARRRRR